MGVWNGFGGALSAGILISLGMAAHAQIVQVSGSSAQSTPLLASLDPQAGSSPSDGSESQAGDPSNSANAPVRGIMEAASAAISRTG